jgi:hemerythrin-like metal-binding protein
MSIPEHFKTGVPQIDEQHSEIFRAIARMRSADMPISREDFTRAVDEIRTHLLQHFAFEEDYMADIGYPGFEEHVAHHRYLVNCFDRVVRGDGRDGNEDLDELLDLLIRDMGMADLGLQEFVEGQKLAT